MEHFIQNYGYWAVFLFACVEGEIALLLAGVACRYGVMSLPLVMLTAFLGTLITEQCLFFVGRLYGSRLLNKYPLLAQKSLLVLEFLKKYNSIFIFGSRFIYGIRNVTPIVIGVAKITPLRFSSLNVPAALIWSVAVAGLGYTCADLLETAKQNLRYLEIAALVLLTLTPVYIVYRKRSAAGKEGKKNIKKP
ncbi:MAG: DedA family protein [Holosporaceae bacterium]|nr:DedA family protein [Holosporaceae bacterium]